jgi:PAS domain S-box-containing protein
VAETASDAIITVDESSTILFLNSAAEKIFGYSAEEMLGAELTMLMPEYLRHLHRGGIKRYVETGQKHISWEGVELPGLHKDGQEIPLEVSFGEFSKNGQHVFTGIVRDITERKRTEEALRKSEEQYRFLAEAIPQQVWTASPDGALDFVNQRVLDYFERTMEEMLGWGWQDVVHEEDLHGSINRWRNSLETGETYSVEFRLKRASDSTYRWHLGRALPVRAADGRIVRWFGTNTDIEEQKLMEEALALMNRKREQMLEEVSTPVVPVWRGVLALPIIGSLDTERMQRATEAALGEVMRTGAYACIIDITAARLVDSHAVANLAHLVSALKLIGAQAIVTGVTAHAARSLVGLGVDFTGIRTYRTLAEALAALIKQHGKNQRDGISSNGISK